jgi:hypothetical protein
MVARQFESFNRMSTFVVHDLKNLVAQLSLMNANAEKHKDNPEFQRDMLETLDHSVQKMKLMLQKLSRSENAENRAAGARPGGAPGGGAQERVRAASAAAGRDRRPEGGGRPRAPRARGRPPDPERDRSHAARRPSIGRPGARRKR